MKTIGVLRNTCLILSNIIQNAQIAGKNVNKVLKNQLKLFDQSVDRVSHGPNIIVRIIITATCLSASDIRKVLLRNHLH